MNVLKKIGELIEHFHLHGCAHELPESVQAPLKHLAEEIDALSQRAGSAVAVDLEQLISDSRSAMQSQVEGLGKLEADVHGKVDAVLAELKSQFAGAMEAYAGRLDALEANVAKLTAPPAAATEPAAVELQAEPAPASV